MGTHIFNSESLWNKTTKAAPAAGLSDYDKTDDLRWAFESLQFENETIQMLDERQQWRSKSVAIRESAHSIQFASETTKDLVNLE
jgi:hypothetical protein